MPSRRVKVFYENRWSVQNRHGEYVADMSRQSPTLDQQTDTWVEETKSNIVGISQPGFTVNEIVGDPDQDIPNSRCITMMLAVIYEVAHGRESVTGLAAR